MTNLTKNCLYCGTTFEKPYTKSLKDWNTRSKYCSRTCLRKNTVAGFTGKQHSEATKEINAEAHRGEKSAKWKGGIDAINRQERKRFRETVRMAVYERDNFQCVECGGDEHLTVDHIKPFSDFPELRFDLNNCRTLCMACHYRASFGRELPEGMCWGVNKRFISSHTG